MAISACGGHATAKAAEPAKTAPAVGTPKAPTCASLKTVTTIPADLDSTGCATSAGGYTAPGIWDCASGPALVGDTGPFGSLWGYLGGKAHHDVPENDPAYVKALKACDA